MDWPNFGWNVVVELIGLAVGVPITIFVIDRLIKKREEKRWINLKLLVKEDVLRLTDSILIAVGNAVGQNPYEVMKIDSGSGSMDIKELRKGTQKFGAEFIRNFDSDFKKRLLQNDAAKWNQIFSAFEECSHYIDKVFSMYAGYLEPKLAEELINVRSDLWQILVVYRATPEAFNASFTDMQHKNILVLLRRDIAIADFNLLVLGALKLIEETKKL
ncbi:MAG TPA: hypothetical protein ACFYD2_04915 [Candidatus Avalokitesvara rifleensis]|uniref:hypothetical protein n=1 Tax=Candidatus Avalokitesvara rifleensis TaxID=3367620 RepID=UPI0027141C58|nr:hypothetical protein [Candidatus Brocadiales bacterium]